MPKGFTENEKELIRRRLLEQGYRLFSAHGLKKVTVEELSEAAGISKGAFYLFYESKEALFMEIAEETVEKRFRREILAAVDLPGPSPRGRLLAILRRAFSLFKTVPLLQFFTGTDYDVVLRRIPPEKLQQHLAGDRLFFDELMARCQEAGIPIRARSDEIGALLYALALSVMHGDVSSWAAVDSDRALDMLLELVAAFCLGEVELHGSLPAISDVSPRKELEDEPGDRD